MMLRRTMLVGLVLMVSGCVQGTFNKAAYDGVKKAAVVQYTLNPSLIIGTTQSDTARQQAVDGNVAQVAAKLTGLPFEVVAFDAVRGVDGYKASGQDAAKGWYLPGGGRVFSAEDLRTATISPEAAKALCAALGVDGVIAVAESWGLQSRAMGFKGKIQSTVVVTMFDKNGELVFREYASSEADKSFPLAGGVVSGSTDMVRDSSMDSVSKSLDAIKARLASR